MAGMKFHKLKSDPKALTALKVKLLEQFDKHITARGKALAEEACCGQGIPAGRGCRRAFSAMFF